MLKKLKNLLDNILFQINKQNVLSATAYFDEIRLAYGENTSSKL